MTRLSCLLLNFVLPFAVVSAKSCGVNIYNNIESRRVVGGRDADRGEFPWQVSLQVSHPHVGTIPHWCGGVIIDRRWILTAAHCMANPKFVLLHPQFWKVRVGEHNLKRREDSEKKLDVSHVFSYPRYEGYNQDIALLRLKHPIEFNDYVKPICLNEDGNKFIGANCSASGWGKTDYHSRGSDVLKVVGIKVFDNKVCNAAYGVRYRIPIKKWHVCAGEVVGGKGTCMGDSGGPLTCQTSENGPWYLLGLTSFGSGCAKPGFPDVYTRVSEYIAWIRGVQARHP